jgi:hypothetical protein
MFFQTLESLRAQALLFFHFLSWPAKKTALAGRPFGRVIDSRKHRERWSQELSYQEQTRILAAAKSGYFCDQASISSPKNFWTSGGSIAAPGAASRQRLGEELKRRAERTAYFEADYDT